MSDINVLFEQGKSISYKEFKKLFNKETGGNLSLLLSTCEPTGRESVRYFDVVHWDIEPNYQLQFHTETGLFRLVRNVL